MFNLSNELQTTSCVPTRPNCSAESSLAVLICNEQNPLLGALPTCIWTTWKRNLAARRTSNRLKLSGYGQNHQVKEVSTLWK